MFDMQKRDDIRECPTDAACVRLSDEDYMRLAIEEARCAAEVGEVPIGAVVVYEPIDRGTRRPVAPPRIVARGHNLRETLRDPSAHAEFMAMRDASVELDAWRLTDCTVYVTLEPCVMCAGLMHQSRVSRCVYGAPDQKAGARRMPENMPYLIWLCRPMRTLSSTVMLENRRIFWKVRAMPRRLA